jgi:outer membrane protein, heavy metal efflux system
MFANIVFIFSLVLLAGCAPLPAKPGFDSVQALVGSRLTQDLAWRQTDAERASHEALVADQLKSPLSLDAALRIALINNPRLQASYEQLGMDYGDLVQAGLPANPSLSFSLRSSSVGVGREFGVVQDVLSLLTLAPRKRLATAMFEETKLATAQQVLQLATEVKKAYFVVHADGEALELAQSATTAAAAAAELAERQHQAGNIGKRELALQQEFHARAVLASSRQELEVAEAREKLSLFLGLTSDQRSWQLAAIALPSEDEIPGLNTLESQAIKQRYDIAAAKQHAARSADALGVANRFRYLSVLGLGVSYARETDGEKLRGPNIELGLPLWDRKQGERLRLHAELRAGERNLEARVLDTVGEVRTAHARLSNARQAMKHFRMTLLPLHERIVAETLKFYNGMLLGVYDLLLARQNQLNAQRDSIEAVKSYWLAKADLEHAVGGSSLGKAVELEQPAPKTEPPLVEHKHH